MRAQRSGLVVHISSVFGRIVPPFFGVYAATKWALEALAETYRYELKPSGVDVVIIQPGPFPTPGMQKRQIGADAARAAGYGALAEELESIGKRLGQMFALPDAPDPQEVADAIVALVDTPVGSRPARVVVHRFRGDPARTLNAVHANVQKEFLTGNRLSFLAD